MVQPYVQVKLHPVEKRRKNPRENNG